MNWLWMKLRWKSGSWLCLTVTLSFFPSPLGVPGSWAYQLFTEDRTVQLGLPTQLTRKRNTWCTRRILQDTPPLQSSNTPCQTIRIIYIYFFSRRCKCHEYLLLIYLFIQNPIAGPIKNKKNKSKCWLLSWIQSGLYM